jgi:hypothetical protein
MGLFGDLDVASANDDPFAIPDNTYRAYVFGVKTGMSKGNPEKGTLPKNGITFTYKIADGPHEGKQVNEWKHLPEADENLTPEELERAKSYLKQRLITFGVPSDRQNDVEADDLIGTEVFITVQTNENGFVGVKSVKLAPVGSPSFS